MWTNSQRLYTARRSREIDQQAMAIDALADGELMQRAGEAAYRLLRFRWPRAKSVLILCGPGNNGGDGYVMARRCFTLGLQPSVIYIGDLAQQAGDALAARKQYEQTACPLIRYRDEVLPSADVMIDALLGSGTDRELSGEYRQLVEAINASATPVLALDLPTGINADSGGVLGTAVKADASLCFIVVKQGLLTGPAVDYVGKLYLDELGVSTAAFNSVSPSAFLIDEKRVRQRLPRRQPNTHKGEQGRILVIGGNAGMTGAACMTGEAALRSGAGLVTLSLPSLPGEKTLPELIVSVHQHRDDMAGLIRSNDVTVIGPGLGSDGWAQEMFGAVIDHARDHRLLIDAEGLAQLAMEPVSLPGAVLTPHPGEAAHLLGCSTTEIQQDRYAAVKTIAETHECVCVLKGAGTLVSDGETVYVCDRGHPGMATAGAGDVLSGLIAGLMGQGLSTMDAACAGVWLHAVAGERAAAQLGNGIIASDITRQVPGLMREVLE